MDASGGHGKDDPRVILLEHLWEVLEDERLLQELSIRQWSLRAGMSRSNLTRARTKRKDMWLSTAARMAHVLGKRIVITLVDEVREP